MTARRIRRIRRIRRGSSQLALVGPEKAGDSKIIYREVRDIDQLSVDLPVSARPMTASELVPQESDEFVAISSR